MSNEVGQILISVLTDQESPALDIMAADLIRRYSDAGVAPSQLLYVDIQYVYMQQEIRISDRIRYRSDF